MSSKLELNVCYRVWVAHLVKATEVTAGLAESNGSIHWVDGLESPAG